MRTQHTTSHPTTTLACLQFRFTCFIPCVLICHSVHHTSALVSDAPTAWPKDRLEKQQCTRLQHLSLIGSHLEKQSCKRPWHFRANLPTWLRSIVSPSKWNSTMRWRSTCRGSANSQRSFGSRSRRNRPRGPNSRLRTRRSTS